MGCIQGGLSRTIPSMSAPAPSAPQLLAAEKRATELLEHQKWRKARDELKPLVKVDRARFLPLLIQTNIGLAREMLAKGQTEEAKQVIGYLRTIASPPGIAEPGLGTRRQFGRNRSHPPQPRGDAG